MKTRLALSAVMSVILTLGTSCHQNPLPQKANWRGTADLAEGRQLSFLMHLDLSAVPPTGGFIVGNETTPIPEITTAGDSIFFIFSEYGALMRAQWRAGRLQGEYLRFRSDTTAFPFRAVPVTREPPAPPAQPGVPPVGSFRVYFERAGGIDSASTATFWVKGDSILGTIIDPSGDYGLLAGRQQEKRVQLHRFTGWQALMIELAQSRGEWTGRLYVRAEAPVVFSLKPLHTLPAAAGSAPQTVLQNPAAPFHFSGVTLTGDTLTSADARFQGRVLLIDIMGSWCHNCMDAAPLLQQLYTEFHDAGLEVVSLAFEIKDDFTLAQKNLGLFQRRYGLTFPILFCGSTAEANVQARIKSQLDGFRGYPTAIFVGRDGRVHAIHSGFHGPGTGERFQQQIREYYETVRGLLQGGEKTPAHAGG
ncbi:MAG: TlpA family protein disulfide reductase [candidate division KSB1 bacterium]|nr:TlpA family protein disulfide reductase [candidate division KSB1 bacterium]MDZ7275013.1 TlpA family protein disulfide reductase [candidate division KSB1 bacterium]MDZ7286538.1 TlpA family protein disulfide reductase [candidate division KSB1 bacterium]MDZ7299298.1 TlpA family protein disulfide reductase [candidate division KSB1 bacterium]MDZ7307362.1 TlpA family protein disulfide reductase [candidate division KSB1 bacterium]